MPHFISDSIKTDLQLLNRNFYLYLLKLIKLDIEYKTVFPKNLYRKEDFKIDFPQTSSLEQLASTFDNYRENSRRETEHLLKNVNKIHYGSTLGEEILDFTVIRDYVVDAIVRIIKLLIQYQNLTNGKGEVVVWENEFGPLKDYNWEVEYLGINIKDKRDVYLSYFRNEEPTEIRSDFGGIIRKNLSSLEEDQREKGCIRIDRLNRQQLQEVRNAKVGEFLEKIIKRVQIKIEDLTSGILNVVYEMGLALAKGREPEGSAFNSLAKLLGKELRRLYKIMKIFYLVDEWKPFKKKTRENEEERKQRIKLEAKMKRAKVIGPLLEPFENICKKIVENSWKYFFEHKDYSVVGLITIHLRDCVNRMVYAHKQEIVSTSEFTEAKEMSDLEKHEDFEGSYEDYEGEDEFLNGYQIIPNIVKEPLYKDLETTEEYYYGWQIAAEVGVTPTTIGNWVRKGILSAVKVKSKHLWIKRGLFIPKCHLFDEYGLHKAKTIKKEMQETKRHRGTKEKPHTLNQIIKALEKGGTTVGRSTLRRYIIRKKYRGDKFPEPKISKKGKRNYLHFSDGDCKKLLYLIKKHRIGGKQR